MRLSHAAPLCHAVLLSAAALLPFAAGGQQSSGASAKVFGFGDFTAQARIDESFLAIPDAKLAGEHLRELTKAPHWASSPEDYQTALYVAERFKAAGLKTEIVPYRVLLNKPVTIKIEAFDAGGRKLMSGPAPEHIDPARDGGDPFQDDPRVLPAFNGSSPSGDVTAPVVYANYGSPADFKVLKDLGISVKGKIVLVRYGSNYRGIKVYDAQQNGAAGVLIYSDPADDGYFRGEMYPKGAWRPESAVQRGATQFLPIYPGDATTPGVASTLDLPDSARIPADKIQANWPSIPVNPLSYGDAAPILKALGGPVPPHKWQGALPFTYHVGADAGPAVTAHMHLVQDTRLRVIWNVIGTIEGSEPAEKDAWVVAGNHRDAWVFGAVDPSSGTAAMLETVHGLGALLKTGWRPKRPIVVASWDAEEEGLIGSTEWAEQHASELAHAAAYINVDVAVSGPNYGASAIPSLKQFVRDAARGVASPLGGTVYDQWLKAQQTARKNGTEDEDNRTGKHERTEAPDEIHVGNIGSGSDYTPFLQHLGVPSTDMSSSGPYGVYHSVFDNYAWFTRNADPTFVYEQQMARVFGLEILHMADADVLPYDFAAYGREIKAYLDGAGERAGEARLGLDFAPAQKAAARLTQAGTRVLARQAGAARSAELNRALRETEEALLLPAGLPRRPWYKHAIYAPGEYTGYAAVVIPGVNEGVEAGDAARSKNQLAELTAALNRAAAVLEGVR